MEEVRRLTRRQDDPEPIETAFELNDTLYTKAQIPPTEEVYIWLGVRLPCHFFHEMICRIGRGRVLTKLGQRDAVVPHRRGGGATCREAGDGEDDAIKLQRGPRLPTGTDHGMEAPIYPWALRVTGCAG